jgi:hypothetical protein
MRITYTASRKTAFKAINLEDEMGIFVHTFDRDII